MKKIISQDGEPTNLTTMSCTGMLAITELESYICPSESGIPIPGFFFYLCCKGLIGTGPFKMRVPMDKPNNIRNIAVTSQTHAGKTTLSDLFYRAVEQNFNSNQTSNEKNITQKLAAKSLLCAINSEHTTETSADVLINWIDAPGRIDFSSEVTAALRLTDGCMIVVDPLEGHRHETLLLQAIYERVVPSLVFNKLDLAFLESEVSSEDIYQSCLQVVDQLNLAISTLQDRLLGDVKLSPEKVNIGFFSALHGWGFTLNQFAGMYASKLGMDKNKLVPLLWGDNYFDAKTKEWTTKPVSQSGETLRPSFCQFILDPIRQVYSVVMSNNQSKIDKILKKLGLELNGEEKLYSGIPLVKAIMQKWIPAHKALLELSLPLPSPQQAQQYRVNNLYTGPQDDLTANSIRTCDPGGPLLMFVSSMVPHQGRFAAFGRVFSGTVVPGAKVRMLGPSYRQNRWDPPVPGGVALGAIESVLVLGDSIQLVNSVTAGNLCCVTGLDQQILKYATLTTDKTSMPIIGIKLSSSVMRVTVQPKNETDLPKVIEGLKWLACSDPLVEILYEEYGDLALCGMSEFHLENLIKDLQDNYVQGIPINISEPLISFRETVLETSSQVCLAKSPNKHNRLYCVAKPLELNLVEAIEEGKITAHDDPRKRARVLVEEFGWDLYEAKNIWAFGPNQCATNILVNTARAQYLNEIQDSVISGFEWGTKEGVLAEERVRGVRFDIMDATLHADVIRRGAGQIIPTARRVAYACQLTAKPRLMEPVYLVDIQCPASVIANVFSVINNRGGQIIEERLKRGVLLANVRCYLPVLNSIGLNSDLITATGGQVVPSCVFHHWKLIPDDPFEVGSRSEEIVTNLRWKKGLKPGIPPLQNYLDKL